MYPQVYNSRAYWKVLLESEHKFLLNALDSNATNIIKGLLIISTKDKYKKKRKC